MKLYQLELDYTNIDCGMSYVFHLNDGRFFIIDGGNCTAREEDRLFTFLKERSEGMPIIAGWFFSHAHDDHIGNFIQFIHMYREDVQIERLIYNFQSIDLPDEDCDWKSSGPAIVKEFYRVLDEYCSNIPVDIVNAGDIFQIGDITVEVLFTHNDFDHGDEYFNDCTTVITTEYAEQKILWLGDVEKEGSRILLQNKLDKLICDIVQVSHHGFSGATKELYAATQARAALWPTPDYLMDDIKKNSSFLRDNCANLFILNDMDVKEHWVGGYGTVGITLPYKFGEVESYPKMFYGCSDIYIQNIREQVIE